MQCCLISCLNPCSLLVGYIARISSVSDTRLYEISFSCRIALRLHRREITDGQTDVRQNAVQRLLEFVQGRRTGAAIDLDKYQRLGAAAFTRTALRQQFDQAAVTVPAEALTGRLPPRDAEIHTSEFGLQIFYFVELA